MNSSLLSNSILALPQRRNSLELCVKVDTWLAVESVGTTTRNALLVTGEGEHGQGHGDRYIDTNLSGLNVATERLGRRSGSRKDGDAVSVLVLVDQVNGIVDGVDVEADQDGAKDLLLVAGHVGSDVGDDGRADKVAVGVLGVLVAAAIEEDGGTLLLSAVNEAHDALLAVRGDDGTKIGAFFESSANLELLCALGNVIQPLLGLADHDERAQGHAALAGGTKGGTDNAVDEVVLVAVGQNGSVVFGTQVGLDTLAVGRAAAEDVLAGLVATDKADSLDGGVVEDKVDSLVSAVDDVDNTLGETSLVDELGEDHGSARVTLRRLENKCVTSNSGNRNTPERNHSREVYTHFPVSIRKKETKSSFPS